MSRREIVSAALLGLLLGAGWAAPAAPASSGPPPAQVTVSDGVKRFGPAWMTQRDGIYVLYLEGSEYDMAFQHATLLREEIQQGEMVYLGQYFRAEIEQSMIGGRPALVNLAERFMQALFFDPIARSIPPGVEQALKGLADGAGLPLAGLRRAMVFSDSGQSIEGRFYRHNKIYPGLAAFADLGCTSFLAVGPATQEGHVLHGRNFDYPGAGWFDPYPTVAFCRPGSGQRFVMLTSAGMHTAGVTALNESGLAVGFHTAITTDVASRGWPVFCLADKIVREAGTLEQAVAILRAHPPAAGFIMVVSSAQEQNGMAVEISRHRLAVLPLTNSTLAIANSYRNPEMQADEISADWSEAINSFARTRRMKQLLQENFGRMDPQKGAEFLGDHFDLYTGRERATGDVIAQNSNLGSVVMDSTAMTFWIASGRAPVGNSRYAGFHFEDGFSGPEALRPLPALHGAWENDPRLEGLRLYIRAEAKYRQKNDPNGAISDLKDALALDPAEPVYAQVLGLLLLKTGQPEAAALMFQQALSLPQTFHKQSLGHLWLARSYDLQGRRDLARAEYQRVLAISPLHPRVRAAAAAGLKKAFTSKPASKISIVFGSGDSYSY
ncbi:MAG: hypothetical protein A2V67_02780 [Deltaproteobacteria bacterium RBG_13_61_14]|nr:MAG: hypothetical protein A2V67_02780 [Deltaproteobacteria bacterium RBG_13_61_14]